MKLKKSKNKQITDKLNLVVKENPVLRIDSLLKGEEVIISYRVILNWYALGDKEALRKELIELFTLRVDSILESTHRYETTEKG